MQSQQPKSCNQLTVAMNQNKPTTKYFSAKRLATLGVLCAMALISFMIEGLFPPLFLPGAKMGISNIFSMLALFLLGPLDAIVVVAVRTVLGSMFSGGLSTLLYSFSAGIVAVVVSAYLVQFAFPRVSVVAISVVSAVAHNLSQVLIFCLVSNTPEMLYYAPWMALLGIVAGIVVGFAVWLIIKKYPQKMLAPLMDNCR